MGDGRDHADPAKLLADSGHARGDAKLIAMAIRKRWPVRDEVREGIMTKLSQIALTHFDDPRINVNAAKAIIQAERQNQVDELHALATGQEAQRQGAAPAAPCDVAAAMDATVPNVAAS